MQVGEASGGLRRGLRSGGARGLTAGFGVLGQADPGSGGRSGGRSGSRVAGSPETGTGRAAGKARVTVTGTVAGQGSSIDTATGRVGGAFGGLVDGHRFGVGHNDSVQITLRA